MLAINTFAPTRLAKPAQMLKMNTAHLVYKRITYNFAYLTYPDANLLHIHNYLLRLVFVVKKKLQLEISEQ